MVPNPQGQKCISLRTQGAAPQEWEALLEHRLCPEQGFVLRSSVDPDVCKHFSRILLSAFMSSDPSLGIPLLTEVISCPDSLFPS